MIDTFNSEGQDAAEVIQVLWEGGDLEVDEQVHDAVEEEEGEHGHVLAVVNVGELPVLEARVELT